MDAQTFLDIIAPEQPLATSGQRPDNGFRLATIHSSYAGGSTARVLFDGELPTVDSKAYPVLNSSGLVPGARVLMVPVAQSMVIVGVLEAPTTPAPGLIVSTYDVGMSAASQTLTTTLADVSTTNLDITTTYPNAVVMVSATWDFRCLNATTTTNSTFVGTLNVAGSDQAKQGLVYVTSNIRLASTATYKIVRPTPGTFTIKQRARITVALAGSPTPVPSVMTQHTGWTATVYETP